MVLRIKFFEIQGGAHDKAFVACEINPKRPSVWQHHLWNESTNRVLHGLRNKRCVMEVFPHQCRKPLWQCFRRFPNCGT